MKTPSLFLILCLFSGLCFGQNGYPEKPENAQFISTDIPRFWEAFDKIDQGGNPFKEYLNEGSQGLKDFIKYRIESPKNLRKTAKKKNEDYKAIRENSFKMDSCVSQIMQYYSNLEEIYPDAVYPPTYFVIGAFNSGGTSKESGLIIGVEMQKSIEYIPGIVAHELIHYNQNYPENRNTLLEQSITEGSADFVAELIINSTPNGENFKFGRSNKEELCKEFVKIMNDTGYHGWLYGSSVLKEGRPRDLGYWIGYEICKAYYSKSKDKNEALSEILNIKDFESFLENSGYLKEYL